MQSYICDFSYVEDPQLRETLREYWTQANSSLEAKAFLGTLVICGSIVEGLLTWALSLHNDRAIRSKRACKNRSGEVLPLEDWNLTNLIEVCIEIDLIGKTAKDASWALKDFRNFIHPYNLLRQSARPDMPLAHSALAAVQEINRSLRGRLVK